MGRVAIIGVGYTPFRATSPDSSYRELVFEAAQRVYNDASVEPKDIDTFISVAEDYTEGVSIFDEYTPDQVGAVLKPMHTITGDGIHGIAAAYMLIATGTVKIALVESHSKASNIVNENIVRAYALDPVLARPLGLNPIFIAGIEARALLEAGLFDENTLAHVVIKNRKNALLNPIAAYPANLTKDIVLSSPYISEPLREVDISQYADGAICLILASEDVARAYKNPVWLSGIGWCSEGHLETRDFLNPVYAQESVKQAYKMAGVNEPRKDLDFAEVDDTYSYKEIVHLEALYIAKKGRARYIYDDFPVNPSGGSLGAGHLNEATGLAKVLFAAMQLRGEAGGFQIKKDLKRCVCMSWRGIPTATGAVAILEA
jgi:acetyl-CoA C-acetyltransferase